MVGFRYKLGWFFVENPGSSTERFVKKDDEILMKFFCCCLKYGF